MGSQVVLEYTGNPHFGVVGYTMVAGTRFDQHGELLFNQCINDAFIVYECPIWDIH